MDKKDLIRLIIADIDTYVLMTDYYAKSLIQRVSIENEIKECIYSAFDEWYEQRRNVPPLSI